MPTTADDLPLGISPPTAEEFFSFMLGGIILVLPFSLHGAQVLFYFRPSSLACILVTSHGTRIAWTAASSF